MDCKKSTSKADVNKFTWAATCNVSSNILDDNLEEDDGVVDDETLVAGDVREALRGGVNNRLTPFLLPDGENGPSPLSETIDEPAHDGIGVDVETTDLSSMAGGGDDGNDATANCSPWEFKDCVVTILVKRSQKSSCDSD
jgi:hypothetical protein